jgi:hypothetical protein
LKFFADKLQESKAKLEDYAKYVLKKYNCFFFKFFKFLKGNYIMTRKTHHNADDTSILRFLKEYEIDCLELIFFSSE